MLQAIHGDPLMRVSSDMPDDIIVLHDALKQLQEYKKSPISNLQSPITLHLKNCGTALRFLQVHLEKCYPGEPITLTGDPRLMERNGAPTSQTDSARLMHGEDIPYSPDESPYIIMTRKLMANGQWQTVKIEADWSAAAFWYEYIAIHGGELLLEGLTSDSIQGDRIVADIYAKYFGVQTTFTAEGAIIKHSTLNIQPSVEIDFTNFPDLYPAIALTCERLGITLNATGTERLKYKESDRLEAVRLHEVRNDHRIAMALMAADFPVSIEEQACIAKSYPAFVDQISNLQSPITLSHITPIRGVNDDNLGKKHALSKLIRAATSDYVWLHDDDVELPKAATLTPYTLHLTQDMYILPLRMESSPSMGKGRGEATLLEKLQIAEYAAIQELTMRTAKKGRAVMCSGANLIVKREVWLACEQDLHPEIPSGDDMFLLEAVKRRGYTVGVIDEPDFTAVVRPQTSWRAFFRQRMRWAGKAPHYTDRDIRRCGAIVAAANILQLLCPPIILIKFPIEYALICRREKLIHRTPYTFHKNKTTWYVALLLEILYPFYLLLSLFGGLFRQRKW